MLSRCEARDHLLLSIPTRSLPSTSSWKVRRFCGLKSSSTRALSLVVANTQMCPVRGRAVNDIIRSAGSEAEQLAEELSVAPVADELTVTEDAAQRAPAATRYDGFASSLEPLPGERFYFAYGSNMSPTVLTVRRKVTPRMSMPCLVPGHYLSFRCQGLPYIEPGFATILPRAGKAHTARSAEIAPSPVSKALRRDGEVGEDLGPDVHGVLHAVDADGWRSIMTSEGVSSTVVGYQVVTVDCHLYDGRVVKALTLQTHCRSLRPADQPVLPSRRYMSILCEGAQAHGVDPAYVAYLNSLPVYQPGGTAASAAKWVVGSVFLATVLPVLPFILAQRIASKRATVQKPPGAPATDADDHTGFGKGPALYMRQVIRRYLAVPFGVTWLVHDYILGPLLGSGSANLA